VESLAKLLIKHKNKYFMRELESELSEFKASKKLMKEIVMNRRHKHVSIYFLCQTWFSIPKEIRRLFNNIFVFRTSKNELTSIFEEVVEQKKDLVGDIARIVYDQPYQYLFINTESQRLFKNFDEIIINTI
jgi:hypothetical protein